MLHVRPFDLNAVESTNIAIVLQKHNHSSDDEKRDDHNSGTFTVKT